MSESDDQNQSKAAARKERAREMRRKAYQAAKAKRDQDPRYQEMKEAAKERRRAAYQAQKAKLKEQLAKNKAHEAAKKAAEEEEQAAQEQADLEAFVRGKQVGHLRLLTLDQD